MLASRRSWWRIAAAIEDQSVRPIAPTRSTNKTPVRRRCSKRRDHNRSGVGTSPICAAPGEACRSRRTRSSTSTPARSWSGASRNASATTWPSTCSRTPSTEHGLPAVVHADSGPAMRSTRTQRPPHRSGRRSDTQPTTRQQRQPVLRIGVPHHEVPAELPRHLRRSPDRTRPGSATTCPGTTSTTATAASRCSLPTRSTTASWTHQWTSTRSRSTDLLQRPPRTIPRTARTQHPKPSSASTCPTKTTPTDSTQLDNARSGRNHSRGVESSHRTPEACTRSWVSRPRPNRRPRSTEGSRSTGRTSDGRPAVPRDVG